MIQPEFIIRLNSKGLSVALPEFRRNSFLFEDTFGKVKMASILAPSVCVQEEAPKSHFEIYPLLRKSSLILSHSVSAFTFREK